MRASGPRSPRATGPSVWAFLGCVVVLTCTSAPALGEGAPKPTGRVSDFAGVMQAEVKRQLQSVLTRLEKATGAEVAVVTLPSVPDGDIERAAVDLFEAWGIGKKGRDNGVLILCAVEQRLIRIEVGYGLEGILPDAKTGRIIDEYILPYFRRDELGTGLARGALAVASVIAEDAGVSLGTPGPVGGASVRARRSLGSSLFSLLFLILMAVVFIRNPSLFLLMMFMGGGRGYGGFHRGGFGGGLGGGFGGFGGGLSGGNSLHSDFPGV